MNADRGLFAHVIADAIGDIPPDVEIPIFHGRKVNIEVECSSALTLGMTVVDWWGVTGKQPNVTLLREINAGAYFDLVIGRLARL